MKIILTIALLLPITCFAQKYKKLSKCYTNVQNGAYHHIPTIAFSYIDSLGNLKWQYCDSLVRKAISNTEWPIDCKSGKRKPISIVNYWPTYYDLEEYYLHGKVVKPVEIKLKPNYLDYYTGSWKVDK